VARGGTLYYPIWLAYAAGVLEKEGHIIRLIDAVACNWSEDKLKDDVIKFDPEIVVVDANFSSLKNDCYHAKLLKEITGALSILVGPPASQFPDRILENGGVDIVGRLEYDFTLREIAEAIEDGRSWKNIKGISYVEGGRVINNPARDFITANELNEIPFVSKIYKEHLNIRDYFLGHSLYPMVQIFTGRGCPYQCIFCSWPKTLMGKEYRVRSIENAVDELEYIADEMPQIREVFIEDDTFTMSKKRIIEFVDEINNRRLDVQWSCNARGNLDYETMKLMKEAGCRLLDVGFESGSDDILKNIKKGLTTEELRRFAKDAKRAGLMILADFVFGFPGETRDTVEQTMRFARELKPNIVQFAIATPIPGTEFYEWANRHGFLLVDNLEDSLDSWGAQKCIISYEKISKDEIEFFVDRALKDYYLNPSFVPVAIRNIMRKNGLNELKAMAMSAIVFMRYIRREKKNMIL
jgi:radical SAM superfamily enzyme YgiQ (UPF0313 family)